LDPRSRLGNELTVTGPGIPGQGHFDQVGILGKRPDGEPPELIPIQLEDFQASQRQERVVGYESDLIGLEVEFSEGLQRLKLKAAEIREEIILQVEDGETLETAEGIIPNH